MAEPSLDARLASVRGSVSDAAREAGRDPGEITMIVVTKFHPASLVRELYELGVRDFGENRHQDAEPKAAALGDLDPTWHFVGQLQSKKVRAVLGYARVLHSVDRTSVVEAIESTGTNVDAFVQLNLTDDPGRGGVDAGDLENLVER
ncbi:MAG: dependent protein, partial [Actinomycetota bacterium]|nr:dependent protein [Actinomycetota bacterium]